MDHIGVVKKNMIYIGLLAVIVLIAIIVFRQQSDAPESVNSTINKSEAYDKVISTLDQFDKKVDGLASVAVCIDNHLISEVDSNGEVSWEFIFYDSSRDLDKEEKQLVYFACVNASGKIKYIGQGWIMNNLLKSNISQNGMILKPESSNSFILPNPTEMYIPNNGYIRYFNEVERVEKDEFKRIEVYDYNPLTKSKSQIKTVSIKKDYFLIDMLVDGESYEWTQERGWINKTTNKEAKVDSYSWEIYR